VLVSIILIFLLSITFVCQHKSSDRMLCGFMEPDGCAVWDLDLQWFPSWDLWFGHR